MKSTAAGKSPGIALVLSAVVPGFGQFYNGEPWKGATFVVVGLALTWASSQVLPPADQILAGKPTDGLGKLLGLLALLLICYVWSLADAYRAAKRKSEETRVKPEALGQAR